MCARLSLGTVLIVLCTTVFAAPLTGKVVDAAGQPVAGAQVWLSVWLLDRTYDDPPAPASTVSAADGAFVFPDQNLDATKVRRYSAVAYKAGLAIGFTSGRELPRETTLALQAPVLCKGTLLGENGQPIVGARVAITSCYQRIQDRNTSCAVPRELQDLLAAQTNATGEFAFSCMAQGVRPTYQVKAAGYGELRVSLEAQMDSFSLRVPPAGGLRGQVTCPDHPAVVAGLAVNVYGEPSSLGGNLHTDASAKGKTDGTGAFSFPELPPGKYNVSVRPSADGLYAAHGLSTTVQSRQVAGAALVMAKTVVVKGRMVDADTRKGIPDIRLGAGDGNAMSGPDGAFSLRCLPGTINVYAYDSARRYLANEARKEMTLGAEGADLGEIALQRARELVVLVVDEAGRPVPDAKVKYQQLQGTSALPAPPPPSPSPSSGPPTDAGGLATLKGFSAGAVVVSATKDDAASDEVQVDPAKQQGPLKLVLRAGRLARMTAVIQDQHGQPITDASGAMQETADNYGNRPQVGPPDAQGRLTANGLTPGHKFRLTVRAPGCWPQQTAEWTAVAGRTQDLGVLTMPRFAGTLSGKVVDVAGKPAAGVTVACTLETPQPQRVITDGSGAFRIEGLVEGPVWLFVYAGNGVRCSAQQARTGEQNVILKAPAQGPLTVGTPVVLPGNPLPAAEARKLARDLLIEALAKAKGAAEWDRAGLLGALAELDPAAAFQAAAEGGDKDSSVKAAVGWARLADEPEEAKLLLAQAPPDYMLYHVIGMIQEGRPLTPEYARQAAEAMLAAAPGMAGSGWSVMTQGIAVLLLQKHDPARAAKLLPDLVARAQKLGVTLDDQFSGRMMTAMALAPTDPAGALALIEDMPDRSQIDNTRAKLAPRIARGNPAKALELLQSIKSDWERERGLAESLCFLPPEQFPVALAEARKMNTSTHRAVALARLAAVAPREQVPDLVTEAMEALAQPSRDEPFQGGFLAMARLALVARRLGVQECREIAWRATAAFVPNQNEWDYRSQTGEEKLAVAAALLDPELARHIIEVVTTRSGGWDKVPGEARGNLLFAAAQVDPRWALELLKQTPMDTDKNRPSAWGGTAKAIATSLTGSAEQTEYRVLTEDYGTSWIIKDIDLD